MTSCDVPPGCNVSDILGNPRADQEAEALMDIIYESITDAGFDINRDEVKIDKLAEVLFELLSDAYGKGYDQAQADNKKALNYAFDQLDELMRKETGRPRHMAQAAIRHLFRGRKVD
jgi:hypothetical protein